MGMQLDRDHVTHARASLKGGSGATLTVAIPALPPIQLPAATAEEESGQSPSKLTAESLLLVHSCGRKSLA
jgi:hypothetical protein